VLNQSGRRRSVSRPSWFGDAATAMCVAAALLGLALRLKEFVANRSLSQDEAMLALNVTHRSYGGLFDQLDYLQGAPYGFLVLAKLSVQWFGENEYALRLVPLLAGSVALLFFLSLARETVTAPAAPLAVLLFALSDPLVNWTVYAKPYAVDVLLTVVLLWLAVRLLRRPATSALVQFGIVGAIAIWLSFASIFALAAATTVLVGGAVARREWPRATRLSLASVPWLGSVAISSVTFLGNLSDLQRVQSQCFGCHVRIAAAAATVTSESPGWRDRLGEFRYASGIAHLLDRSGVDLGLVLFVVALLLCAVGCYSFAQRLPELALLMVLPLLFMLLAWGIGKYPLLGRTQLFLVAPFVLLLSEGIFHAIVRGTRRALQGLVLISAVAIALLIAAPSIGHVWRPRRIEDLRPVLTYLAERQRRMDRLYVHYTAEYQFRFYLECGCGGHAIEAALKTGLWPLRRGPGGLGEFSPALLSAPPRLIVPPYRGRDAAPYVGDLERLRGAPRAWFVLSSLEDERRAFLLSTLNGFGRQLAGFKLGSGKNASAVYLYDLASP
jgi:hypothetical protein